MYVCKNVGYCIYVQTVKFFLLNKFSQVITSILSLTCIIRFIFNFNWYIHTHTCICYFLSRNYRITIVLRRIHFCVQKRRYWIVEMRNYCIWNCILVSVFLLSRTGSADGIQVWGMQFGRASLLEKFSWKKMDFAYPDERSRQLAIASGEYVPENSLPVGIEIWRNRLFVTIPRWRDGECPKYRSLDCAFAVVSINDLNGATDRNGLLYRKTRRDVSKSWTGSRRRHNTRRIAIGGTRLDSRLSDFRLATKSAENHECALNGSVSVFVDLRLHLPVVPPTLSLPPPLPSAPPAGRETRRRAGLFMPSLPFIHSIFLHALCLLYTLARATVFCFAQRPDNDGGTLCKIFNVLPFRPSPLHFLRGPLWTLLNSFPSRIPYVSLASFLFYTI